MFHPCHTICFTHATQYASSMPHTMFHPCHTMCFIHATQYVSSMPHTMFHPCHTLLLRMHIHINTIFPNFLTTPYAFYTMQYTCYAPYLNTAHFCICSIPYGLILQYAIGYRRRTARAGMPGRSSRTTAPLATPEASRTESKDFFFLTVIINSCSPTITKKCRYA